MVLETVVDFWALTSTLAYTEGGRVNSVPQVVSEAIYTLFAMHAFHMAKCITILYVYTVLEGHAWDREVTECWPPF